MVRGSDLGPTPSPQRQLQHTVDAYLRRYFEEQLDRREVLDHKYRTALNVLVGYQQQELHKLSPAQREEMSEASRTILRIHRTLDRLEEAPQPLAFNDLRFPHQIPADVLEYLWSVAGYHRAWGTPPPGSEAEEDSRHDA